MRQSPRLRDYSALSNGQGPSLGKAQHALSKAEKLQAIEEHISAICTVLGLDLHTDSLKDTPKRVAKMYVEELFSGLDESNKPQLSLFDNDCNYHEMLIEKDISFYSTCEHHFMPMHGRAHVAYIPDKKFIGLSKLNRLVQYCAARPQLQERLTSQILEEVCLALNTQDAAVWLEAKHLCVSARGVKDHASLTVSSRYSGRFLEEKQRREFLAALS